MDKKQGYIHAVEREEMLKTSFHLLFSSVKFNEVQTQRRWRPSLKSLKKASLRAVFSFISFFHPQGCISMRFSCRLILQLFHKVSMHHQKKRFAHNGADIKRTSRQRLTLKKREKKVTVFPPVLISASAFNTALVCRN